MSIYSNADLSLQFKIGVKQEVIGALRKAFGSTYPDEELRNRVQVVQEYPLHEISYPMVIFHFNPGQIRNMGIGHYEKTVEPDGSHAIIKRWLFDGTITLTVYALTPLDRDMVIVGLLNMFAFGPEIPGFEVFWKEIHDYDFVALQINTDSIREGGDSIVNVPWGSDEDPVFTDSLTLNVLGEFATNPRTGGLVQINNVDLYPYLPGAREPIGSTATTGTPGTPDFENDSAVPWDTSLPL